MKEVNLRKERYTLVNMFYRYLLMNNTVSEMKQQILDQSQGELSDKGEDVALDIAEKSPEIFNEIKDKLSDKWDLDRLPALIKAILLVGAWEIKYTNTDKPIVINEMVNYCKDMEPDYDYKFVNAILDKFVKEQ
ncbi:transcription antitermination protein NusB [Mesoplasma lactucae]|uniref:Transcription antitermination factor NusB n=1 Tax=Mesoplasma lactucae ATCC 49193 TaxID=81460 RepID=A0A291IR99_9MOLU|nr:transcription antitermination protein NusB [Mesoplasma lactucae]ATG97392.1 transcription antitermination factor NusB [Mesoplasma lactucae ATCC 49193]ATZ20155.1 transcription antitermination protein NusB [Mesoplasma lactucae ATCC 49193]MCL8216904.1 hypothetical protein [Mesoplasma lactucae ATCC 49193]